MSGDKIASVANSRPGDKTWLVAMNCLHPSAIGTSSSLNIKVRRSRSNTKVSSNVHILASQPV